MAEQRLIDANELPRCEVHTVFSGKEYISVADVPYSQIESAKTIDPETLPIVRALRAEIERLTTDGKQDLWAVERKRREDAEEKLKRVKAEHDAAMSFIPKTCATCKYGNSPCDWCVYDPDGDLNWEWNGKAKEDANE